MRWDALFEDLEAQAESLARESLHLEVAERTRGERAGISLAARLAGSRGAAVTVALADGTHSSGVVHDTGQDWVLLADGPRQRLVALSAVAAIDGLAAQAATLTAVESRLGMAGTLRALSRARQRVAVHAGTVVVGLIASVGADHIDVVTDVPSRRWSVPTASIREVVSA
ncbi:hypothetical protein [Demequina sp.]|uniref:hypothetical protein n=1 Tax=Demequina sp. TaxID=2050685 RepID=UPI003A88D083